MTNVSDEKKYLTFDDLTFQRNPVGLMQAKIHFENGWGASVLKGDGLNICSTYEVTVLRGDSSSYDSEVASDIIQIDDLSELNGILRNIQDLDENGIIQQFKNETKNSEDIRKNIEQRKNQIKKSRQLRKEIEIRHPEEKISGPALADEIAKNIIYGRRTITPEVGAEIRRRKAFEK